MQHFLAPCQKYDCYNGGNCEYLPNWPPEYAQCICPDEFVGPHCKLGKHHQLMLIYRLLHRNRTQFLKGENFEIYFIPLANKCETESVDCGIHGKCVNDESDDGYTCYCQPGYTGDKCEKGNFAWKYSNL